VSNCCSHGTFLHFSLQSSHLNICYYHRDLHFSPFHSRSPQSFKTTKTPSYSSKPSLTLTIKFGYHAWARSIFSASWFGRWVVTHSLAGSNFHGHRPAVWINSQLLWCRNKRGFLHLNLMFGSSRIASSAYQKWPTRSSFIRKFRFIKETRTSYIFKVWE